MRACVALGSGNERGTLAGAPCDDEDCDSLAEQQRPPGVACLRRVRRAGAGASRCIAPGYMERRGAVTAPASPVAVCTYSLFTSDN